MTRIPIKALEGALLNVTCRGDGPTIVGLHGFTGSLATWDLFTTALNDTYGFVGIDLLGHGGSDSPNDAAMYSMERFVLALEEILNALELEHVYWLGYSLGGRIALSAASVLAHRTAGVVLESASPGLLTSEERHARIRDDELLADWLEDVGMENFVDYWQALPLWASQARLPTNLKEKLRSQRLLNDPIGLGNSLRGIGTGAQRPMHDQLGNIDLPVLVIAGEDDGKFSDIAKEMCEDLVRSELCILAQAGHAVHLEQPAAFHGVVQEFLKSIKT